MPTPVLVALVGLGGMLGAVARYGVGSVVAARFGAAFPVGTLVVNVSGAFLIGVVAALLLGRWLDPAWRPFLVVGVLGGYTTFSAYAIEVVALVEAGRWTAALLYVLGSNLIGLLACALGLATARWVLGSG